MKSTDERRTFVTPSGATKVLHRLTRWMALVASFGVVVLVTSVTVEVIARGIVGRSIPGALELAETLLVVIVFLGLAYGESTATHVRMTLLTDRLPFGVAQVLRTIGYVLA